MASKVPRPMVLLMALCLIGMSVPLTCTATQKLSIVWRGSTGYLPEMVDEAFHRFAKERGIELEIRHHGGWPEHYEKLRVQTLAGVAFDVTYVDQQYVPNAAVGVFADLTPFIQRDRVALNEFTPLGVNCLQWKGKQYAMPVELSNHGVWYNVDLFEAAGIAPLPTQWESSEWTWDDFVQIGRKLTRNRAGSGPPDQFGLRAPMAWRASPFLWGGDWVTPDGQLNMLSEPVITGITKNAEISYEHAITVPKGVSASRSWQGGLVGMQFTGPYLVRSMQDITWTYSVGVLPKGTTRQPILYTNGLAMGALSTNKELAWEFIKAFSMNPEYALAIPHSGGNLAPRRSLQRYFVNEMTSMYPTIDWMSFLSGLAYGKVFSLRFSPNFQEIESVLSKAVEAITAGDKPTRTAFTEIEPTIRRLFHDSR